MKNIVQGQWNKGDQGIVTHGSGTIWLVTVLSVRVREAGHEEKELVLRVRKTGRGEGPGMPFTICASNPKLQRLCGCGLPNCLWIDLNEVEHDWMAEMAGPMAEEEKAIWLRINEAMAGSPAAGRSKGMTRHARA